VRGPAGANAVTPEPTDDVTRILAEARAGNLQAAERLFPLVYRELRALAGRYLGHQRPGHTLQPTALVHEAYVKLVSSADREDGGRQGLSWSDRGHFFATAALAMRQILVNHAKSRGRQKRGGGRAQLILDEAAVLVEARAIDLIALDEALTRLAERDPQQARIVDLRFFAGLSVDETARMLDVSERTVHRDWGTARLWLRGEIGKGNDEDGS